jgi:hypothetical protein
LETARLGVRSQPSGLSSNPKKFLAESPVSPVNGGNLLTGGLRTLAKIMDFKPSHFLAVFGESVAAVDFQLDALRFGMGNGRQCGGIPLGSRPLPV